VNVGIQSLWKRFWKRVILFVLIVEIAGAAVLVTTAERKVEDAIEGKDSSLRLATERSVNEEAGYSFRYPAGWSVKHQGAISKSTSPQGDVIVAFGFGPPGDLLGAFDELQTLIRASYEDIRIKSSDVQTIGGRQAVVVGGLATNDSGARLRLKAAVVEGERRNYLITAFAAETAQVKDLESTLSEIFHSLSAQ
jgi:hypothetical protein